MKIRRLVVITKTMRFVYLDVTSMGIAQYPREEASFSISARTYEIDREDLGTISSQVFDKFWLKDILYIGVEP